jgi:epoxide hydrolase
VPTAFAAFLKEIASVPRELVAHHYNLRRYTEFPRGGHFAALEQPAMLIEDLRNFFRPFR